MLHSPGIGIEIHLLRVVAAREDQQVKERQGSIGLTQIPHSRILEALQSVPAIDMVNLMSQGEPKSVVLILADPVQQSPRDVDIPTRMGKSIDGTGIEDDEFVNDSLARDGSQERLGGIDKPALSANRSSAVD